MWSRRRKNVGLTATKNVFFACTRFCACAFAFLPHMHILGLELGVIGGLITPVCSYMLSESLLCHSTVVGGLPCVVL